MTDKMNEGISPTVTDETVKPVVVTDVAAEGVTGGGGAGRPTSIYYCPHCNKEFKAFGSSSECPDCHRVSDVGVFKKCCGTPSGIYR